jgi:phenylacetate-CoA ligase
MFSSSIYKSTPIALQELLIAGRSWARSALREGRSFGRASELAEVTQWHDAVAMRAHVKEKLASALSAAGKNVPFYEGRLATYDAADDPFEAIASLPLIGKAQVRDAGMALHSNEHRQTFKSSTSGTTGSPLLLRQTLDAIVFENAMVWRQLNWAGLRQGDRRAWIRGDMIVPVERVDPPFWRMNRAENSLMFSSYHLSDSSGAAYIEALEKFNPIVIQAYPSAISFLANHLKDRSTGYRGNALKAIVTSSETLNDEARDRIESAFGTRVFDWYGQAERVAAVGTCEYGHRHIVEDYSFVELLPTGDGFHEIVGSSFSNPAMPLFRYRTGDIVEIDDTSETCGCGRHFRMVKRILGRDDDNIKLPNGRQVGRIDHIFKGLHGILEAQVRQEVADCIRVLVVPGPGFTFDTARQLQENAAERIGDSMRIEIEKVESLPRTANGKVKGVVCLV